MSTAAWDHDTDVGDWWAAGSRTPAEAREIRRVHRRRTRAGTAVATHPDAQGLTGPETSPVPAGSPLSATPAPAYAPPDPLPPHPYIGPAIPDPPPARRPQPVEPVGPVGPVGPSPSPAAGGQSGSAAARRRRLEQIGGRFLVGRLLGGRLRGRRRLVAGIAAAAVVATTTATALTLAAPSGPPRLTGTIEFPDSVQLGFVRAGQISAIYVRPGDPVYRGEALATESDPAATTALADAQRVLLADQALLASLQSMAGVTGDRIASAEATLATAQASYDQALLAVEALTLTSPIAGRVAMVTGAVGSLVQVPGGSATALASPGSGGPLPLIALTAGPPVAVAVVPQDVAIHLRSGIPARVAIPALGRTTSGTVVQLDTVPVNSGGPAAYRVEVALASWPVGALPGMTIEVSTS
ncbi:MAG: hypothetical protein KGQ66_05430 [Acidobacteriota bacterium]|nr:hypothetical protein [Acidobacteriota bacterium]